jgi:hypothetical protein
MGGRKHKNYYRFVQPQLSHQAIAEQRVNREYRNMEVLNSYWVGEDGNYKFFEVILADPSKPTVNVSSAVRQGKAFRGLTAAGNSRSPSRKKGLNKRLRRKDLARRAFHYEPYVKKAGSGSLPAKAAVPPRHPKPHGGEEKKAHAEHGHVVPHEAKPETQRAGHEHSAKPAHANPSAHEHKK